MTSQVPSEDPNKIVIEYLNYYCDPRNPFDFAVMLKGRWGAGKTHLIKTFLKDIAQNILVSKAIYVSLFGITTYQQIDDELFRQLHPILSSKGAKIAAAVGKGLLKGVFKIDIGKNEQVSVNSQLPDINLKDYIVNPNDCILIFDDLERCSIQIFDVLGYINAFVEHEGLKAIIVANEDEILTRGNDPRYAEIKEKLIGRTLEIHANTESAIKEFFELVRHGEAKTFLIDNINEIL
jgi:Cdc6-like AAA superfamily ATPase